MNGPTRLRRAQFSHMTLSRTIRPLAVLILALATATSARADVIFTNLGPGDTYTTTGGQSVGAFSSIAVPFIPAADATAATVTVAMKSASGSMVNLSIRADNGNRPSQSLLVAGSTAVATIAMGDPQVYTATFALPVGLTGGVKYWIAAVFNSGSETWMPNSTGGLGYAGSTSGGTFSTQINGTSPAVRIETAAAVNPTGACCAGATCIVTMLSDCPATGARFAGAGLACNHAGNTASPCCYADFDQSGTISVTDIFAYLNAWFAGSPSTDIDGGGLGVSDIFAFLNAWFAGC